MKTLLKSLSYCFVIPLCLNFLLAGNDSGSKSSEAGNSSQDSQPSRVESASPHHEITVTATRTRTAARELGKSVTLVDAREIRLMGAETLAEVLGAVPGFSLTRVGTFGGQTSLFSRGGESSFNLVLIDGIPVNQPGGFFDFADLSTTNVERIEIVRGPASVLYGTEAVSSTINIITRPGEGEPSGHLQFEGGNYGSFNLGGSVQGSHRWFHYSTGVYRSETNGIYDFNSQYDRSDFSGKFDFELGEGSSLSTHFRYTDSEQHFPTDETGAVVDPNDFRESRQGVYAVSIEKQVTPSYSSKVLYGYHHFDSDIFTLQDNVTDFFEDVFQVDTNRHYVDW